MNGNWVILSNKCRQKNANRHRFIYQPSASTEPQQSWDNLTEKNNNTLDHYIFCIISLKHDDVKNQNKPAALCIVGFIGGPLSVNPAILTLNVNVPDLL